MPWKKTDYMNERVKFIATYLEKTKTFSELCDEFEISRKTGYKWVERYEHEGVKALEDRSRRPLHSPNTVSDEVTELLLEARRKHPRWGPKKLLVIVQRKEPKLILPAASTVGEILKRNDLVKKRGRRRTSSPYGKKLEGYDHPNAIWGADFKGHFPVGGKRCFPLTMTDGFSRYLIRCKLMPRPLHAPVQKEFELAFREYGLPDAIRTDNGAPFSTLAPGGLSRLSVWWIKLGIRPERIQPGRPDQNGRHERMHSTLKAETASPPKSSFQAQQTAFTRFLNEYNKIRPHEALDFKVPSEIYKPSFKEFPNRLPEIEYPSHFRVEKSYPNGVISLGQTQWYISGCLRSEFIGLEAIDNDVWKVYFGPIALGYLDGQTEYRGKNRYFGTMIRIDGEITTTKRRPYRR